MTATPAGVVYLVEGVIFAPLPPPLRCAFRMKALTFLVGRRRRRWRRSLPGGVVGSSAGGGCLFSSENVHICACLRSPCLLRRVVSVVAWRMLCRLAQADALPPCRFGFERMLCRFVRLGGCFATLLCRRSLHPGVVASFSRFSCGRV